MKAIKINATTKGGKDKFVGSFEKLGYKKVDSQGAEVAFIKTDFVEHNFLGTFVDLYNQSKNKNDDSRQNA